jgi:ribonuclease HI
MLSGFAKSWEGAAVKIYFDGGCRPNPGNIETAVVAAGITLLPG